MLPDAYGLLGQARRDEGLDKIGEAEELLREAVRLAPEDTVQTSRLASLLMVRARIEPDSATALREEAKEMLTEALKNADGYGIDRQLFDWALPYHPGAIKYYKEIGAWTAAAESHNNMLLKRQDVLAAAWKKVKGMDLSAEEHAKKWRAERAAALDAAGLVGTFR